MLHKVYVDLRKLSWTNAKLPDFNSKINQFRKISVNTFAKIVAPEARLFKFHVLDNIVEDLCMFGMLNILDASAIVHYNVHFKASYSRISIRKNHE